MKPIIDPNPPPNMGKYYFDKQLIQDVGVHLSLNQQSTSSTPYSTFSSCKERDGKLIKSCFYCKKNIRLQDMRSHVGGHILRDEMGTSRTCGFCGQDACETRVKSSRKGPKTFISVEESDCPYFFDYGRVKVFNKKKNSTTNRITAFSVKGCKSLVWIYNMKKHFTEKHGDYDFSEDFISQEEFMHVSKF